MKIGIIEGEFYSLQQALIEEGNDLYIFLEGCHKLEKLDYATHVTGPGTVQQVMSLQEFKDMDFIIANDPNKPGLSEMCKVLHPNIPMMWYSCSALLLESDREIAHALLKTFQVEDNSNLRLPKIVSFNRQEEAQDYIDECDYPIVIKCNFASPSSESADRTIVVRNPETYEIPKKNAWFKDNSGGCTIESFIEGQEVSFGCWFNGKEWVGNRYYYIEHKGACNYDRGQILTGEVGTSVAFIDKYPKKGIENLLDAITPILKDKCCGMIDINTIYDEDSQSFYFMEFTIRFGRPTLETMIAFFKHNNINITEWFYNACSGNEVEIVKDTTCVTGVTLYSYGLPVLSSVAEHFPTIDVSVISPSFGCKWLPDMFEIPEKTESSSVYISTLFNMYDHEEEYYVVKLEDRNLIVCGVASDSHNILSKEERSRMLAYRAINSLNERNFYLKGITWRDDVSVNFEYTSEIMKSIGMI